MRTESISFIKKTHFPLISDFIWLKELVHQSGKAGLFSGKITGQKEKEALRSISKSLRKEIRLFLRQNPLLKNLVSIPVFTGNVEKLPGREDDATRSDSRI